MEFMWLWNFFSIIFRMIRIYLQLKFNNIFYNMILLEKYLIECYFSLLYLYFLFY